LDVTKSVLISFVDRWIEQTCTEASTLACVRVRHIRRLATDLSHNVLTESIKLCVWSHSWSRRLLCDALNKTAQLNQLAIHADQIQSPTTTVSRRIRQALKRSHRTRETKPRWIRSVLARGGRNPQGTDWKPKHSPTSPSFTDDTESSSESSLLFSRRERKCFYPSEKRLHYRVCGRLGHSGQSHCAKYFHLQYPVVRASAPIQVKKNYAAGWHFRSPSTHNSTLDCTPFRSPMKKNIPPSDSPPTDSVEHLKSTSPSIVHVCVTDRLYRFSGSVATECCAQALQKVRLLQLEHIIGLIYATGCSAGVLLSLLMDYGAHRSKGNDQADCLRKTGPKHSPSSLFDFLHLRLNQMLQIPRVPVC
uniref:PNPLA domain-containing protein n=1 Tax=Echinostoma caproni TaxID=27848 RepID=A0A183AS75_9TREM